MIIRHLGFTSALISVMTISLTACQQDRTEPQQQPQAEPTTTAPSHKVDTPPPSATPIALPTHCKETEISYLNAQLQKINRSPENHHVYELEPTEQRVSLCFSQDPLQLSFRLGAVGHMTVEHNATPEYPFGTYFRRMGNQSENMVFLHIDEHIYYIVESDGIASGVSLYVYNGADLTHEMYSGPTQGTDFELNFIDIPESILLGQEPPHEIMF